jgi:hypothetical protein
LDGFAQVLALNRRRGFEVDDCAGDFEDAVVGADGQS